LRCVFFGEHSGDRHARESLVGDVAKHVGVGKFFRLDHYVRNVGGIAEIVERKRLHDVEHFESGDALPVGRNFVHGPAAIGGGDGFNPLAGKIGEVFGGHRSAECGGGGYDAAGNFTFVICVAAAGGNLFQRACEIRVAKYFSETRRAAVDQKCFGGVWIGVELFLVRGPIFGVEFGYGKSVLGVMNGGSEKFRKFFGSEAREKFGPAVHGAGNGDGIDTDLRHCLVTFGAEKFDGKLGGGPAAGVAADKPA